MSYNIGLEAFLLHYIKQMYSLDHSILSNQAPNQSGKCDTIRLKTKFEDSGENRKSQIHLIQMAITVNQNIKTTKVGLNYSQWFDLFKERNNSV